MASALFKPLQQLLAIGGSDRQTGGPFSQPPLPVLHVSHFGVIPKRYHPGKWRLILDLSSPAGHSVNNSIAGEHFPLHNMVVDEITAGMRLGRGSLIAKLDVQMHSILYQSIQRIAGCRVLNEVLPFMSMWSCPSAVRSAPYIFTCIADSVQWVAKRNYDVTFLMHYLDD